MPSDTFRRQMKGTETLLHIQENSCTAEVKEQGKEQRDSQRTKEVKMHPYCDKKYSHWGFPPVSAITLSDYSCQSLLPVQGRTVWTPSRTLIFIALPRAREKKKSTSPCSEDKVMKTEQLQLPLSNAEAKQSYKGFSRGKINSWMTQKESTGKH